MHTKNIHAKGYHLDLLAKANKLLAPHIQELSDRSSIDFSNPEAVLQLNKALLMAHYGITFYEIPENHLSPPVPSRADYLYYIKDLLPKNNNNIKGLDIGTGANCIYPIIGAQAHGWYMVGCDISKTSIKNAKELVSKNKLSGSIDIRYQADNANIFKGIIQTNEHFDFVVCNPPFFASEKDANKASFRKNKNLNLNNPTKKNFQGVANELWCNGGEALFIKRMIKQSAEFKNQVALFSSLVSQKEHLPKLQKLLTKLKAEHTIIPMEIGNKKSRFIWWKF